MNNDIASFIVLKNVLAFIVSKVKFCSRINRRGHVNAMLRYLNPDLAILKGIVDVQ